MARPRELRIRHNMGGDIIALKHLRQLRALYTALVAHIVGAVFFGHSAVNSSSQSITLALRPTVIDELGETVTAVTPALITSHAQHIEPADQITEYGCAVAGHSA
jgi:hypothetical protein